MAAENRAEKKGKKRLDTVIRYWHDDKRISAFYSLMAAKQRAEKKDKKRVGTVITKVFKLEDGTPPPQSQPTPPYSLY